jgi:hypothetical protein
MSRSIDPTLQCHIPEDENCQLHSYKNLTVYAFINKFYCDLLNTGCLWFIILYCGFSLKFYFCIFLLSFVKSMHMVGV